MKLFLIYIIFVFALLAAGVNSIQKDAEQVYTTVNGEKQVSLQSSDVDLNHFLIYAYSIIRKSFSLTKQIDMLEDDACFRSHFSTKIVRTGYGENFQQSVRLLFSKNFLLFLSERHQNGFYIYSLKKLII